MQALTYVARLPAREREEHQAPLCIPQPPPPLATSNNPLRYIDYLSLSAWCLWAHLRLTLTRFYFISFMVWNKFFFFSKNCLFCFIFVVVVVQDKDIIFSKSHIYMNLQFSVEKLFKFQQRLPSRNLALASQRLEFELSPLCAFINFTIQLQGLYIM